MDVPVVFVVLVTSLPVFCGKVNVYYPANVDRVYKVATISMLCTVYRKRVRKERWEYALPVFFKNIVVNACCGNAVPKNVTHREESHT